jgi:hypothetical protein
MLLTAPKEEVARVRITQARRLVVEIRRPNGETIPDEVDINPVAHYLADGRIRRVEPKSYDKDNGTAEFEGLPAGKMHLLIQPDARYANKLEAVTLRKRESELSVRLLEGTKVKLTLDVPDKKASDQFSFGLIEQRYRFPIFSRSRVAAGNAMEMRLAPGAYEVFLWSYREERGWWKGPTIKVGDEDLAISIDAAEVMAGAPIEHADLLEKAWITDSR